jgi:hypothetical protein
MSDTRAILPGHRVVLVDASGRLVRQRGRVLRGLVLSVDVWDVALVELARSGEKVTRGLRFLRRCPELAFCRPALRLAPGAA